MTTTNLTPEEARAVLDLHHLRERFREEDGGYVGLLELREILGVTPDELDTLVAHVREVLPSRLATSDGHLNQREAELVVSYHARRETEMPPPIISFPAEELIEVARSRSQELWNLEHRTHAPGRIEDFGVPVGENPYSWHIAWIVMGVIGLFALIMLLISQ